MAMLRVELYIPLTKDEKRNLEFLEQADERIPQETWYPMWLLAIAPILKRATVREIADSEFIETKKSKSAQFNATNDE